MARNEISVSRCGPLYERNRTMKANPIVGTVTVTHETPHGILAKVDGRTRLFPNRQALFRAAVELLDARLRDNRKEGA
jgi:hypothetical protein